MKHLLTLQRLINYKTTNKNTNQLNLNAMKTLKKVKLTKNEYQTKKTLQRHLQSVRY